MTDKQPTEVGWGWYLVRRTPTSTWEPAIYDPDWRPEDYGPWQHSFDDEFPRVSKTVAEWRGPYNPEELAKVAPETIAGLAGGSLVAVEE